MSTLEDSDWGILMSDQTDAQTISALRVEIKNLHRDNERRDKLVAEISADVKDLLALANQSKGGIWVGMTIASLGGSLLTWIVTHVKWGP